MPTQPKAREDLIALRRAAIDAQRLIDKERLECHRQVVELLKGPHAAYVREKAHEQINKWEQRRLCNPRYVVAWREWLSMPISVAELNILREDDVGVSMRQNSPFGHAFELL